MPDGTKLPFAEAVERFDVPAFVEQARECGAGHVLFTITHGVHQLPCPHPEVDRLLPGRTCGRDLIMELADALARADIKLILYYNHGAANNPDTGDFQDPEWQRAVGAWESGIHAAAKKPEPVPDRQRYYDNYCRVVSWLGEHYGPKVLAWWFDSGQEHARFPDTPWERFTMAAKAGYPDRLVCYNSGVFSMRSCTPFQDYWAGELNGLNFSPDGHRLTPTGLSWYAFCSWASRDRYWRGVDWVLNESNFQYEWPEQDPQAAVGIVRSLHEWVGGAVTFNLLCYQDGRAHPSDLATMRGVRKILR